MNKISSFCDRIIEASWLVALMIAPLFVNFHSSVSFEPDKSIMVRSIALIMLAAFIIRRASWGELKSSLKHPLFIITLLFGLSYLVSTFLSILPTVSWWGSYSRGQGAYSLMGYFVIFAIIASSLKTREQLERILVVIVFTSMPVILYGFAQKLKLDLLKWDAGFSDRIISTQGNPIFLGSYLVMVIPITLYLLIRSVNEFGLFRLKSMFFIAILLAQVSGLIMTESRGPLLGLNTSLFFFIVLSGLVFNRRYLAWGGYIVSIMVLGFFLTLALSNTLFQDLKSSGGRLSRMFEARESSAQIRIFIWEGVVNMVKSDYYRALVGYGPEAMFVPYHKYCPPKLITSENKIGLTDRSHNELFDTVLTNGLIGALLYLLLCSAIIFYAFKALGLIKRRAILIGLLLLFGLAGMLIPIFLNQTMFIALGVPLGLVLGAMIYLFCRTVVGLKKTNPSAKLQIPSTVLLIIALLSALIGHFVEVQFGIDLTASRTYFYVYLAILIRIVSQGISDSPLKSSPDNNLFSSRFSGLVITLMLSILIFDFVHTRILFEDGSRTLRIMLMLISIWILSVFLFSLMARNSVQGKTKPGKSCIVKAIISTCIWSHPLIISAGGAIIFFIILIIFLPPSYISTVAITVFYIWILGNIIALAWSLPHMDSHPALDDIPTKTKNATSAFSLFRIFLSMLIAVGAIFIAIFTCLNQIKADIIYKIGSSFEIEKKWDIALDYYKQAVELTSNKGIYYSFAARMCLEKYYSEKDPQIKNDWYDHCLDYLNKALKYNPMDPIRQANLGRLYRIQGHESKDSARRTENFNLAIRYCENACKFSPQHPALRNELGEIYHEKGQLDEAIKQYSISLKISNDFSETYSHLGDAYMAKSNKALSGTGQADIENAVKNYYQAAQMQARIMPDLLTQNQKIMFERTNLTVIKYYPQDYVAYYNLGRYYAQNGRHKEAIEIMENALPLADEKTRSNITELLERLKSSK